MGEINIHSENETLWCSKLYFCDWKCIISESSKIDLDMSSSGVWARFYRGEGNFWFSSIYPFIYEHCGEQNPKMFPKILLMYMHHVIPSPWLWMGLNWLDACSLDGIMLYDQSDGRVTLVRLSYYIGLHLSKLEKGSTVGLEEANCYAVERAKPMIEKG